MQARQRKYQQQGFTIIELIVATVLFAIVIGLATTGFGAIQQVQRNERYYDMASTAGQRIIEELRNGQYNTYDIRTEPYDISSMLPSSLPSGIALLQVSQGPIDDEHKVLSVDVKFDVGTYQRHVYVTGVIAPGGITQ